MNHQTPTFQARVYTAEQTDKAFIALIWYNAGKSFFQKVTLKKKGDSKMYYFDDGNDYIVAYNPDDEKKVRVFRDKLFSTHQCEVMLKEKESSISL